jgi:hypothetical protein
MPKISLELSEPLPPGVILTESIIILKCMDEDGMDSVLVRNSVGLAVWDSIGMLTIASDLARREAQSNCLSHSDEDD